MYSYLTISYGIARLLLAAGKNAPHRRETYIAQGDPVGVMTTTIR
jgi:hypothetical protein